MTQTITDSQILARIGQLPPGRITDARERLTVWQIDLMRELHEDYGVGYRRLSRLFGVCKTHTRRICLYER